MAKRPGPPLHRQAPRGESQRRQEIATEAARIMAEQGVDDFGAAKRKAAARLLLGEEKNLPTNQEVQAAFERHIALFHPESEATLRRLREVALAAMQLLRTFEPRAVGNILSGTVTAFSNVQLHVVAEAPEDIQFFLEDRGIPAVQTEKRLRFGLGPQSLPSFHFRFDDIGIDLTVFDRLSIREAPLSPVDGKPMRRAGLSEVARWQGTP